MSQQEFVVSCLLVCIVPTPLQSYLVFNSFYFPFSIHPMNLLPLNDFNVEFHSIHQLLSHIQDNFGTYVGSTCETMIDTCRRIAAEVGDVCLSNVVFRQTLIGIRICLREAAEAEEGEEDVKQQMMNAYNKIGDYIRFAMPYDGM